MKLYVYDDRLRSKMGKRVGARRGRLGASLRCAAAGYCILGCPGVLTAPGGHLPERYPLEAAGLRGYRNTTGGRPQQ